MPISFVVYAAIPDDGILEAAQVAEAACAQFGGTCDWEFYDSERVVYWFSKVGPWRAFIAHCVMKEWKVG